MNALDQYLAQTCNQPLLSDEETRRLVARTRHGHAHVKRWAMGQLVEHNMRLVSQRAKRFRYSGIPYRDLMQRGVLGLIRAIELYDDQKAALSTYAALWIDAEIRRLIGEQKTTIRQPDWRRDQLRQVCEARERLVRENGGNGRPTIEDLENETGISRDDIERLYLTGYTVSLDVPVEGDDGATLVDFLPGGSEDAEAPAEVAELWEAVAQAISELGELDSRLPEILFLYYVQGHTCKEIGAHFGVTRARISQIKAPAVPILREKLARNKALAQTWRERDCRLHNTPSDFVLPIEFGS